MPPQIGNQTPPKIAPPVQNSHKHTRLALLTIVMILIGILAVGYFMWSKIFVPIGPMPPEFWDNVDLYRQADFKTYKSDKYGFEFKYPARLTITENNNGVVVLFHKIPYKNYGDCDMLGEDVADDYLTDFEISLEMLDEIKIPSVVDGNFNAGILNGDYEYYGAEGCGDTNYYFVLGNKTLLVKRKNIQLLSGLINNAEEIQNILKIPGAISKQHYDGVFKEILSTFKFISTSTKDILPPDPGEAGKATIEGIDSDNDGIRDDVFRVIILSTPDSERKREGMKQMAKAFQAYLLATSSQSEAKKKSDDVVKSMKCLRRFLDIDTAPEIATIVQSSVINTEARLKAYFYVEKLQGTTSDYTGSVTCDFDPDALPN